MELTWGFVCLKFYRMLTVVIYTSIIRTKKEKNKTRTGHETANEQQKNVLTNKGAHAGVHTHIRTHTHTHTKKMKKDLV